MKFAKIVRGDHTTYLVRDSQKGCWEELTERRLAREIPNFRDLRSEAREKEMKKLVRSGQLVKSIKIPDFLENMSLRYTPHSSELIAGTTTFLQLVDLFSTPKSGYTVAAYILAGLHAYHLRKVAPDVRFSLNVTSQSSEIAYIFMHITDSVVVKNRWKKKRKYKIKRSSVIDCRSCPSEIGTHLKDFDHIKLYLPHTDWNGNTKIENYSIPSYYIDTIATVLGGSSSFLREAEPYMRDACVFIIGCERCDWTGSDRLATSEISQYDPAILKKLDNYWYPTSYMLYEWWCGFEDEDRWAEDIIAKAKASFGKPDSQYISVTYNLKKLSNAVAYQAFLSFLDFVVRHGWLAASDAERYRAGAKSVFDPEPVVDKPVRRIEQSDVFEEIMRSLFAYPDTHIIPDGERFVKSEKKYLGAIRTISNVDYFVMPEDRWKNAYLKAARKIGVDVSLAKKDKWELTVMKAMSEARLIKAPSSGYRYRYDLYEDGSRDTTYVVAIPISILDPGRNQAEPT